MIGLYQKGQRITVIGVKQEGLVDRSYLASAVYCQSLSEDLPLVGEFMDECVIGVVI